MASLSFSFPNPPYCHRWFRRSVPIRLVLQYRLATRWSWSIRRSTFLLGLMVFTWVSSNVFRIIAVPCFNHFCCPCVSVYNRCLLWSSSPVCIVGVKGLLVDELVILILLVWCILCDISVIMHVYPNDLLRILCYISSRYGAAAIASVRTRCIGLG